MLVAGEETDTNEKSLSVNTALGRSEFAWLPE